MQANGPPCIAPARLLHPAPRSIGAGDLEPLEPETPRFLSAAVDAEAPWTHQHEGDASEQVNALQLQGPGAVRIEL